MKSLGFVFLFLCTWEFPLPAVRTPHRRVYSKHSMRYLGELAQARNDGVDIERASATWSTSSFSPPPRPATLAVAACTVGDRDRDRAGDQDERPLLLKSCRVRRGALEALGPGSPGV